MNKKGTTHEKLSSESLSYAFGHTETWLEIFAQSIGCTKRELTDGVAALLQSQGSWPGADMRQVRESSTAVDQRLREVAVDSSARAELPGKTTHKKRVKCAQCGKRFSSQGFTKHVYWRHGAGASKGKQAAA